MKIIYIVVAEDEKKKLGKALNNLIFPLNEMKKKWNFLFFICLVFGLIDGKC